MFEKLVEHNKRSKGMLAVITGAIVIAASLVFSTGYLAPQGLIGSLPNMTVVVFEGKYYPADIKGETTYISAAGMQLPRTSFKTVREAYYEGRLEIPTKYFLLAGCLLIGFGIYTRASSRE